MRRKVQTMVVKMSGVIFAMKTSRLPTTQSLSQVFFLPSMGTEPSADGDLLAKGSDSSSPDERIQLPTAARTAARKLQPDLFGSGIDEELGRTGVQTRVLNREARGLVPF